MHYVTANAKLTPTDPEYTRRVIHNWNEVVTNLDTVFHLGTFALERSAFYLQQLNGSTVAVVGNNETEFYGPKFRDLFLYADGTFHPRKLTGRGEVVCILRSGEKNLTDSEYPEIFAVDEGEWRARGSGERIVGADFAYLLNKPVVNVNIDLWDYKPVSIQMIVERYFGYFGVLPVLGAGLDGRENQGGRLC